MTDEPFPKVKVLFRLPEPQEIAPGFEWPLMRTESVWAQEVGKGRFKIDNIPFFANEISYEDVVSARSNGSNDLWFSRVLQRSGNSTFRVIMNSKDQRAKEDAASIFSILKSVGCEIEWAHEELVAINVPKSAFNDAYAILSSAQEEGLWLLNQGHIERLGLA